MEEIGVVYQPQIGIAIINVTNRSLSRQFPVFFRADQDVRADAAVARVPESVS